MGLIKSLFTLHTKKFKKEMAENIIVKCSFMNVGSILILVSFFNNNIIICWDNIGLIVDIFNILILIIINLTET